MIPSWREELESSMQNSHVPFTTYPNSLRCSLPKFNSMKIKLKTISDNLLGLKQEVEEHSRDIIGQFLDQVFVCFSNRYLYYQHEDWKTILVPKKKQREKRKVRFSIYNKKYPVGHMLVQLCWCTNLPASNFKNSLPCSETDKLIAK